MNASFVISGLLTICGAVLLRGLLPPGRLRTAAGYLWVLSGLGKVIVGFVPENTNLDLHLLGALNIPIGSVAILLISLGLRRGRPRLATVGVLIAVVGLVGTVLSTAGQYAGAALYLGLGPGGMERLAGYPATLWLLLVGAFVVMDSTQRPGGGHGSGIRSAGDGRPRDVGQGRSRPA